MPRKFDPLEYNYELISDQDGVFHFQKIIQQEPSFADIVELAFWSKQNVWIIFIEGSNLKQFATEGLFTGSEKISLFIGQLKTDFDFEFQMKRICMDPQILIQLGA